MYLELPLDNERRCAARSDARQAYVDGILESLPIIAYDLNVAVEHAELLVADRGQGRPRGAHDLLIAATARATDRTIVTADQTAFTDLPGVAAISHPQRTTCRYALFGDVIVIAARTG